MTSQLAWLFLSDLYEAIEKLLRVDPDLYEATGGGGVWFDYASLRALIPPRIDLFHRYDCITGQSPIPENLQYRPFLAPFLFEVIKADAAFAPFDPAAEEALLAQLLQATAA